MKRKDALAAIAYATYHGDTATAMRIYAETRLSYAAYKAARARGWRAKQDGKPCGCSACGEETRP